MSRRQAQNYFWKAPYHVRTEGTQVGALQARRRLQPRACNGLKFSRMSADRASNKTINEKIYFKKKE